MLRLTVLILVMAAACAAQAQSIQRSASEVRAFRAENPCPATGRTRGACPGWQVDHPRALCAGGLDHRTNMAWLSVEDHKWKTFVDIRECRKFRRMANTPARQPE
jgi:hypothetical protein